VPFWIVESFLRDFMAAVERHGLFHHLLGMTGSREEQAARLRIVASGFRESAAQTAWPAYRNRMLEMAVDLEREADQLELRAAS
jgi:hypothetical protein